jgi:peptidoglycan/xylan/chitin deacetylase (PgdA/CDA1 family)
MRALARPPALLRKIFPGAYWRMKKTEKVIYLTFDDGPVPGATSAALSILREHGIKASFFCVGDNVRKHPEIYRQVIADGHRVGNHTVHHVDGWRTNSMKYLREVQECAALVDSVLFRPPYGRMRRSVFKTLRRKYKIVMWDVLTCDFDLSLAREHVLEIALMYSRPGSIVVFHDSEKALRNMQWALPKYIEEMKAQGYEFRVL